MRFWERESGLVGLSDEKCFFQGTEEAPDLGKHLRSEILLDADIMPWVETAAQDHLQRSLHTPSSMGHQRRGSVLSLSPVRTVGRVCSRTAVSISSTVTGKYHLEVMSRECESHL